LSIIDLHVHSTFSDGTCTPSEIIRLAEASGIGAVAITDHDTIDGIDEFESYKSELVKKIKGIEISVQMGELNFHMVGLFLDHKNHYFTDKIDYLKKARIERNHKIVKKLNELQFDITIEELEEIAKGEIGRPHISEILLKKGYFTDRNDVFNKLLKKGAPAYFDKFRYSPKEAISLIKEHAKGLSVLAHPGLINLKRSQKRELISQLKDWGLDAIEVYYSEHTSDEIRFLEDIAKRFKLLKSGGSDFHGENKKGIFLGTGRNNNLNIDFSFYQNLKNFWEGRG